MDIAQTKPKYLRESGEPVRLGAVVPQLEAASQRMCEASQDVGMASLPTVLQSVQSSLHSND